MKIALFGVSGMVGSRIAQEALSRGHHVTGIVRHPENVTLKHDNLTIKAGSAADAAQVAALASGHDALVSAVVDRSNTADILTVAKAIIAGAKQGNIPRVLVIGGAGSLEVAPGVAMVDTPQFPAEYRPEAATMRDALNLYRAETDLNWTFVSPSIMIMPGERTGKFRLGGDAVLFDAQGNSQISAEDFAVAIIDELENPQHIRARFTVGY